MHTFVMAASLAFVLLAPVTVLAHGQDSHEHVEAKKAEIQQRVAQQKTVAKERLDAAKLKACHRYSKNIIAMMNRVTDRRQAQVEHITEIAAKTRGFYTKKGYILSNYHELSDDVGAKKAAAEGAVAATRSVSQFDCTSDGPKAQLQAFREARASTIDVIQEYRHSVKKLIEGVKSAQNQGVKS